jgi:hypothetical protein
VLDGKSKPDAGHIPSAMFRKIGAGKRHPPNIIKPFVTIHYTNYVKFGKYADIIKLPVKNDRET